MTVIAGGRFVLLTGLGIDNFGTGLFLPLPVVYATSEVGLTVGQAGAAVAIGTVAGFALPPLAGRLTHRFGPRFTVTAALWLQSAGAFAYLLATSFLGVVCCAVLMVAGSQAFFCSVSVLVADMYADDDQKERPFAIMAMVRSAAFGLGTLVAAVLLTGLGDGALRLLVTVDGVSFALAAVVLTLFVSVGRQPAHGGDGVSMGPLRVLRDGTYRNLLVATCLLGVATDFALVGTPVFVIDVLAGPRWLPGALLAFLTVLSSVVGLQVVRALRGRRRTWSLQLAGGLYAAWGALSIIMVWLPVTWLVPFAFAVWLAILAANKIFFPVAGALSEAMPPRPSRAAYMATYQYAFTTAGVIAPALVSLFDVASWLPWALVATSALCGVAILRRVGAAIPAEVNGPAPALATT
jgi:MFS family permease